MVLLVVDFRSCLMMVVDSHLMLYAHHLSHVAVADNRNPGHYLFQFCL